MGQTFDNATGEPVNKSLINIKPAKAAMIATAAGLAIPAVLNSGDVVKVVGKVLTFVGKNPKLAIGLAAIGAVCYGIHRFTEPGTKVKKTADGFEYERSK